MSNYKYEQLLSITIDNALLHLWISVATTEQYVSREARSQILVKWFKPKIKQAKYKLIKKDLRSIVLTGRANANLLEKRLCELRELSLSNRKKVNDMHKLHYLLEHLNEDYGIKADLTEGVVEYQPNTLYVSKKNLEDCFSEGKCQVKPILMILSGINIFTLTSYIQKFGFHKVEEGNISHCGLLSVYLYPVKAC
ncbi:hypothetical protein F0Z19_3856 [Vibrio cyclitrophicus]|nr:hypothetical protein F0Z19_3856 [Vibrio cyclitrophicus]